MFTDKFYFEVFEQDGLYGLRLIHSKYIVLPPIYKSIKLSLFRSTVETNEGKKLGLMLGTYGDDIICLSESQNGQTVFYFVDKFGRTVLTLDQEWQLTHHCRVSDVLTCFMCGVANLELQGSNEYHSYRALIDITGKVITEYCMELKEEVLNPLDYLNYDGYGLPPKWDPEEEL